MTIRTNAKKPKSNNTRWLLIGAALILIAILGIIFIKPDQVNQAFPSEVSPSQASEMKANGAFILDVREQDEWMAGHIKGATLISLGDLPNRIGELPKDKDIVVVCRSGRRSAEGRDILLKSGFTRVTSMTGGMNAWASQEYQVVITK